MSTEAKRPEDESLREYRDNCDRLRLDSRWKGAETYDDLLAVNAAYVKGELPRSPYYLAPLERDSQRLRPGLLAMHGLGMMTLCGQAALRTSTYRLTRSGGYWENVCQRAYVEFCVPERSPICRKLIQRLPGAKGLKSSADCERWRYRRYDCPERLPLTWRRKAKEKAQLARKPWRVATRSPCNCHSQYDNFHPALVPTVNFFVTSSSEGEGNLEERIVKLCE